MKETKNTKRNGLQILVPVDLSAATAGLLAYTREFAAQRNVNITVLHVVEAFHPDWHMDTSDLQRQRHEHAARVLRALIARTFPDCCHVRSKLCAGHPVDLIIRYAKLLRADIILIATHGRTGLMRTFLGSVAERVVRRAPCPVLVVK